MDNEKIKCSKCGIAYTDINEIKSVNETGKCITCKEIIKL